jgi:hypothetical protein
MLFLLALLALYPVASILVYAYCVLSTWLFTKIWSFKIGEKYIGICKYPQWLMYWMYWITNRGGSHEENTSN